MKLKLNKSLIFLIFLNFGCWSINTFNNLDFSKYLPEKLNFCGSQIDSSDTEYKELEIWLKDNIDNWKGSPASFVLGNVYEGEGIHINVFDDAVIVNFTDENGKSKQVVHKKRFKDLKHICSQNYKFQTNEN